MRPLEVRLLPSRWVAVFKTLGVAAIFVGMLIALANVLTPAVLVVLPVLLLIVIFYLLRSTGFARTPTLNGAFGQHDDVVTVDRRAIGTRSSMQSGTVIPETPDGVVVRLERRFGDVDLGVPDVETGQEVLSRLKLDVRHAVARFRVLSTSVQRWRDAMKLLIALPIVMVILAPVAARTGAPWILAVLVPLVLALVFATVSPSRMTVGADGIAARRLFRQWFRGFEGVADVRVFEEPYFNATLVLVELLDRNGVALERVLVDQKKSGPFQEGVHAEVDARAMGLAERIREALELRDGGGRRVDRASLARGGRDADTWLADLRSLLSRKPTFRDSGPPTLEALLATVEDVAAPAIERAAAAAALPKDDAQAQKRLRIAAETSVEPKLRLALEAAAEDDEGRLSEALSELDAARHD